MFPCRLFLVKLFLFSWFLVFGLVKCLCCLCLADFELFSGAIVNPSITTYYYYYHYQLYYYHLILLQIVYSVCSLIFTLNTRAILFIITIISWEWLYNKGVLCQFNFIALYPICLIPLTKTSNIPKSYQHRMNTFRQNVRPTPAPTAAIHRNRKFYVGIRFMYIYIDQVKMSAQLTFWQNTNTWNVVPQYRIYKVYTEFTNHFLACRRGSMARLMLTKLTKLNRLIWSP